MATTQIRQLPRMREIRPPGAAKTRRRSSPQPLLLGRGRDQPRGRCGHGQRSNPWHGGGQKKKALQEQQGSIDTSMLHDDLHLQDLDEER